MKPAGVKNIHVRIARCVAERDSSNSSSMRSGKASSESLSDLVSTALLDEQSFVEMAFKGRVGVDMPYRQVSIRPVVVKGRRQLQFSFFTERQNVVKNHEWHAALAEIDSTGLLDLSWSSVALRSLDQEVIVQVSRKGRPIVHRTAVSSAGTVGSHPGNGSHGLGDSGRLISLDHDRAKQQPISASEPHPFLQKLGMQTAEGRIK